VTASVAPSRLRALSGALDQAFSSTSNGFIIFAVAVVASPEAFGHITILMTSLMAVLSCLRGGLGIPLLLKANQSSEDVRREGSLALATVLVVSPFVSIGMLTATPQVGFGAVSLVVFAPFVLGQDVLRYVSMAAGRPQVAALWDGIWCLGTLLALICSWFGFTFVSMGSVLACWGFLALIAFVAMSADLRLLPSMRGFMAWIKPYWQHRVRYAADAGLEQVGLLLVFAIVSAMVNPDATGALRGAIALLAPLVVIASAVQLVLIPESVRSSATPYQVWRIMTRVGIMLALMTGMAGLIFYYLPSSIGFYLLGESFESSQQVIPVMTVQFITACVTFALLVYLRTFNRSAEALWMKVVYLVAILVATVITALWIGSAVGVAVGLTMATTVVALIGLFTLSPRRRQMPIDRTVEHAFVVEEVAPTVDVPMNAEPLTVGRVSSGRATPQHVDAAAPASNEGLTPRNLVPAVGHTAPPPRDEKDPDPGRRRLIIETAAGIFLLAGFYIAVRCFRLRRSGPGPS
jgi:O-antigen/teichoic acid export membrane protein